MKRILEQQDSRVVDMYNYYIVQSLTFGTLKDIHR